MSEKSGMLPETDGVLNSVRGEAVFLDLGEGRNLVALLARGPNAEGADPLHDWAPPALGRMREGWYRDAPRWTGVARLRGDLAPALATFADLSDPGSARLVRPTEFGAVFGPGYSFVGALLEMADAGVWPLNVLGFSGDPVTRELAATSALAGPAQAAASAYAALPRGRRSWSGSSPPSPSARRASCRRAR